MGESLRLWVVEDGWVGVQGFAHLVADEVNEALEDVVDVDVVLR